MASYLTTDNQYVIDPNTGDKLLYVHRYVKDFETDEAINYFEQKQKAQEDMINRYKSNLIASVVLPQTAKDVLNYGSEQEFNTLVQSMDQGISNALAAASKADYTDLSVLNAKARQVYKNVSVDQIKRVADIIDIIEEGATLLSNSDQNLLSVALNTNKLNLKNLNAVLTQALIPAADGTIVGFGNSALNSVARSLNNIITKSLAGEKISLKSMSSYLNNIFATGLGEGIIAKGLARQVGKTEIEISEYLTGAKGLKFNKSDLQSFYNEYKTVPNITYKPDVQSNNFQFEINDNGDTMSVNLGLSVKTYNSLSKKSGTSIVTGKSFSQMIETLFSDGLYYVYNTLGLLDKTVNQYRAMKAAIVANFADNFLSGTGLGQDFSQYMVINGQYYSVYSILQQVLKYNSGASSDQKDAKDPVTVSIQKAGELKAIQHKQEYSGRNSWLKAWNRSKEISAMTGKLTIHGTFYPSRVSRIVVK